MVVVGSVRHAMAPDVFVLLSGWGWDVGGVSTVRRVCLRLVFVCGCLTCWSCFWVGGGMLGGLVPSVAFASGLSSFVVA